MNNTILFIAKKKYAYVGQNKDVAPYGLHNSSRFIVNFLRDRKYNAVLETVDDANDVDRVVSKHDAKIVVIEALWITPEKMSELISMPSHKNRLWVVRIHSKTAFLASEGIAIDWMGDYPKSVVLSANSKSLMSDFSNLVEFDMYLPNIYYPSINTNNLIRKPQPDKILHVGCFGAIRPMKNHLVQAMAAMRVADRLNQTLNFHVNGFNIEESGLSVMKNLEALFEDKPNHQMVKHEWLPHTEFINLVRQMDVGTQISFSESFNIVAADFVGQRVPIVVSDEISWLPKDVQVSPHSSVSDIAKKIFYIHKYYNSSFSSICEKKLHFYNATSMEIWDKLCKRMKK